MKGGGLGICGALPQVVHFPIDDVRVRARTERGIGSSRISFTYKHGLQLWRRQQTGLYSSKYFLCKHCLDQKKVKTPLAANATSQSIVHLLHKHRIGPSGRI